MTGAASAVPYAGDEARLRTCQSSTLASPQKRVWVLAATILGSSIASIDGTVVNVALPTMQRSLGATSADLQWVIEGYSLFLSALILVGGSLGDQLGRRKVFGWGISLFAVASIVCGLAPNIGVLISARAIQGVGGALLVPGSLSIISATFPAESRGQAIGTWAGFSTITTAIGPVLGGWLVQAASWRWVFLINVPLAAITLAILWLHVPESKNDEASGPLDWLGAAFITGGLGAVVFALIEAGPRGLGDPLVRAIFVAGLVLIGLFVLQERRSTSPMMPLDIFRSRQFTGANLLTVVLYGALSGTLYFLPFNLQQVQGYGPAAAGASLLPFTVIVFALSRWTGGLVGRYGAKLPLIVGPIITGTGFLLFAVPSIGGSYWTTFFPAVVVMSLGMSLVIAPLTTTVMNALDTNRSGVASGVNNAVSRAAGLLAIAVFGLIVANIFNASLDSHLNSLSLPAAARASIVAQRAKLVGDPVPSGLSSTRAAAVETALKESFVSGFRVSVVSGAILAALSALFAAWLISGKKAASSS